MFGGNPGGGVAEWVTTGGTAGRARRVSHPTRRARSGDPWVRLGCRCGHGPALSRRFCAVATPSGWAPPDRRISVGSRLRRGEAKGGSRDGYDGHDVRPLHRPRGFDGARVAARSRTRRGVASHPLRIAASRDRRDRRDRGQEPGRRPDGDVHEPQPGAGVLDRYAAGHRTTQPTRPGTTRGPHRHRAPAKRSRRTATTSATRWSRRPGCARRRRAVRS